MLWSNSSDLLISLLWHLYLDSCFSAISNINDWFVTSHFSQHGFCMLPIPTVLYEITNIQDLHKEKNMIRSNLVYLFTLVPDKFWPDSEAAGLMK